MSSDSEAVTYAVALLSHYGFDLRGYGAQELVDLWLRIYPANWVRLGVIEALYQGRYKAVSVEQMLAVWSRRGRPTYHFNHEFERLISRKLPKTLTARVGSQSINLIPELKLPPTSSITDEPRDSSTLLKPETDRSLEPSLLTATPQDLAETAVEVDARSRLVLLAPGASPVYEADWSRCEVSKHPIHQFTPPPDASGFSLKLKAVAEQQNLASTNVASPVVDEPQGEQPPSVDKN